MPLGSLMLCAGGGLFLAVLQEKEGFARRGERCKAAGFAVPGGSSEVQLRLLLDSTAEGIYALDLEGNCKFCNSAGLRLLGFPDMESVLGRNMHSLVHHTRSDGSPHPASQCHILNAARLAECVHIEDEPFWRTDGMPLFVEYWARPIIHDGKVVGAAVAFHDITSRRQAQEALKDQARQLQALFDNTRDAVVIEDGEGRIVDANHAAAEMFGLARHDLFGRNIRESMEEGYPIDENWDTFLQKGSFRGQRTLIRADGSRRIVDFSATAHFLHGRHLAFYRDITQQQELEAQFRQAQKMEAVGRLAGGVAHDFNNLLMVIGCYAEMVHNELPRDHISRKRTAQILEASRRAAGLTAQLLAFSRKQIVSPAIIDLNQVVGETTTMLRRMVGEDIDLRFSSAPALWAINADPDQIVQVLMNLCVNSRDAMPLGGDLTIATSNVTLHDDAQHRFGALKIPAGEYVALTVSDTGLGISKEVQGRMFEPFFTTKEVGKGTGLGLSTVYGIVQQSSGNISVESELGKGASFRIYLPKVAGELASRKETEPDGVEEGTETLLLVEDEDALRTTIGTFLRSRGYTVLEARSGDHALSAASDFDGAIDLLLTDVVMPRIGGRELSEMLQSSHPKMKQIFMSGYTDDAVVRYGICDAGVMFLQKPFTMTALAKRVREVLATGEVVDLDVS
jgi:PAS domain S-box-containing protein